MKKGRGDFFKDKRGALSKPRKAGTKIPKPESFLIVTEGTQTEPNYFQGLADYIEAKFGTGIDVKRPYIESEGVGKGTIRLVEEAEILASNAKIIYSQIWVVFDKDDFKDFDIAISEAEKHGYHVAWSNQSFEYWLYLHFNYSDSALHRSEWVEKLEKLFRENHISSAGGGYDKNDPEIFEKISRDGGLKKAVRYAEKVEKTHKDKKLPSACDPCTKVHHLILELKPYISELL